jgi:cytochrome c oxidase subunit 2
MTMPPDPTLPNPPSGTPPAKAGDAAAGAELRWSVAVIAIVVTLLGMMLYMSLHYATMPAARIETIDPTRLHLSGEFIENNLGTATEADGSVTVRMVGNQYSFTPQCILVPADTPVRFRVTSADVVHGFSIAQTNVNVMLVPGYISVVKGLFRKPADLVMPCHEFCGIGHAAMWAHVRVIEKAAFFRQANNVARQTCVE